jgi:endogenous inhibitor of DNA gyrase (YacG/DUF329 family)
VSARASTPKVPGSGTCPICQGAVAPDNVYRPFCRERCKMVDLSRWFRGEYVVPGPDAVMMDPEDFAEALRDLEERARAQADDAEHEGGDPEPEA